MFFSNLNKKVATELLKFPDQMVDTLPKGNSLTLDVESVMEMVSLSQSGQMDPFARSWHFLRRLHI